MLDDVNGQRDRLTSVYESVRYVKAAALGMALPKESKKMPAAGRVQWSPLSKETPYRKRPAGIKRMDKSAGYKRDSGS